jgi:hypothetical protein
VRADDWWLDYTFVRRHVDGGAPSRFVTVIDAPRGDPVVQSVRVAQRNPLVVEVTHASGTDRITLDVPLTSSNHGQHRDIAVRVESEGRDIRIGEDYYQSAISALDYDAKTIVIDDDPALEVGAPIRIYHDMRSNMYHVTAVDRSGGKAMVTLDATALFARGPVSGVGDGRVDYDTRFIFATGRLDRDGNFVPGCDPHVGDNDIQPGWDRFADAWIGEGEQAYRLRGAVRPQVGHSGDVENNTQIDAVFLRDVVDAVALRDAFEGKVVSIWNYGVGDRVEIARLSK